MQINSCRYNVVYAKNIGFCFGVENAVNTAFGVEGDNVFAYGEIIHNDIIINRLRERGIVTVDSLNSVPNGSVLIIRSHGVGKDVYAECESRQITVVDATCPFVANIHNVVNKHYLNNFSIIIVGSPDHAEVVGINGWCNNSAIVVQSPSDIDKIDVNLPICLVCQTTFKVDLWKSIQEKALNRFKTVEIFDTICYTTYNRQREAFELASKSHVMLVLGCRSSSNTNKLRELCERICKNTYLIQSVDDLKIVKFPQVGKATLNIGVVAGASTPKELITEVQKHMSQKNDTNKNFDTEVSTEFAQGVENSFVQYKKGKRLNSTVISADESGIKVAIGGKSDAFIPADEVCLEGEYNPADYNRDDVLDVIIIDTTKNEQGLLVVSKKEVDRIKEGDKVIETIRDGQVFTFAPNKDTKGGLLGKLGTYTVFIPASQIKSNGYVSDLKSYIGKNMRLSILDIDDSKHKIVASAKKVIDAERAEKAEAFWGKLEPGVIVTGKVKRVTDFGAFVNVDSFDCLAHIVDLAWYKINKVEEVLTIGNTYDFVVLNADRERNRVSLGYKQLQKHPFEIVTSKYTEGSVVKGKVVRIVQFGAFINIENGVDGLVHVSEASHAFVKNIGEVLKIGDEVEAQITKIDFDNHKISLSIKALLPEVEAVTVDVPEEHAPETVEEAKAKTEAKLNKFKDVKRTAGKPAKKAEKDEGPRQWSEEASNNPFADLLKDFAPTEASAEEIKEETEEDK